MKKLLMLAVWLAGAGSCLAQDQSAELQLFYQRFQGFDFNAGTFFGTPIFDVHGANPNGGGFGFVYNLNPKFGFFQQTGFFQGVEQNGLNLRIINETQGLRVMKPTKKFDLYAKGGLGFNHYVFNQSGNSSVFYGMAFIYGGGTEARLSEGLFLILEADYVTMSLPNITGAPDRSKWDNALLLTTGIAIRF